MGCFFCGSWSLPRGSILHDMKTCSTLKTLVYLRVDLSPSQFILSTTQNAQTNHGDQGLPSEGSQKGCQVCQDKEKSWEHQIQSALLPISLHLGYYRQREGRETEAVPSSWSSGQGTQVILIFVGRSINKRFLTFVLEWLLLSSHPQHSCKMRCSFSQSLSCQLSWQNYLLKIAIIVETTSIHLVSHHVENSWHGLCQRYS